MGQTIQELTVPLGITTPSFVWQAQNSRQTPDAIFNVGQILFDLKECWAFMLLPVQLFRTAVPLFSNLLETFLALGLAEAEDSAIFATSTLSNGPTALMSAVGITTVNTGGSANGGNLAWSDITGVLEKSTTNKVKPPLVWFMAPRSLTRLLSLLDSSSRPLLVPTVTSGLDTQAHYELLGWPIFLSNAIPITDALGSGTNQSKIILANPKAVHIAQDTGIQMLVSTDFALDSAQIGLRIGARRSFAYAPGASFTVLLGVN
jgi:HK97 family phage major capsid protein